jgi:hypothetical protein
VPIHVGMHLPGKGYKNNYYYSFGIINTYITFVMSLQQSDGINQKKHEKRKSKIRLYVSRF